MGCDLHSLKNIEPRYFDIQSLKAGTLQQKFVKKE